MALKESRRQNGEQQKPGFWTGYELHFPAFPAVSCGHVTKSCQWDSGGGVGHFPEAPSEESALVHPVYLSANQEGGCDGWIWHGHLGPCGGLENEAHTW